MNAEASSAVAPIIERPTRGQLFWGFTRIGVSAFGGVLPYAHRELVTRRHWLTDVQFTELLAIGQLLPGPNIVNVAIMLGRQTNGLGGALAAGFGILLIPFFLMVAVVALYANVSDIAWVSKAFQAIGAAASGLILGVGIKLARTQPRRVWAAFAFVAAIVCIGGLRYPVVPVMLAIAAFSIFAAWKWGR